MVSGHRKTGLCYTAFNVNTVTYRKIIDGVKVDTNFVLRITPLYSETVQLH